MAFKKGQSGNPAGRPDGAKGKIFKGWKETIDDVLRLNGPELDTWISRIAATNPQGAIDALVKLAEFTNPKLQRTMIEGSPDGVPILYQRLIDNIERHRPPRQLPAPDGTPDNTTK